MKRRSAKERRVREKRWNTSSIVMGKKTAISWKSDTETNLIIQPYMRILKLPHLQYCITSYLNIQVTRNLTPLMLSYRNNNINVNYSLIFFLHNRKKMNKKLHFCNFALLKKPNNQRVYFETSLSLKLLVNRKMITQHIIPKLLNKVLFFSNIIATNSNSFLSLSYVKKLPY